MILSRPRLVNEKIALNRGFLPSRAPLPEFVARAKIAPLARRHINEAYTSYHAQEQHSWQHLSLTARHWPPSGKHK